MQTPVPAPEEEQRVEACIEARLHHDTISALRGVQVGFELLNGITLEQGRKILGVLNENVVGVVVTRRSTLRRMRRQADEVRTKL